MTKQNLRIIPLGGLGEVGRNMLLLEYRGKILIIDAGLRMPEEDMPGIDYIIPNTAYLKEKRENILGVIFTHGHYDHIGAIPYLIPRIGQVPMYASSLTKGIILKRQEDFLNQPKLQIETIKDGSKIQLGPFQIEFFRQNHNIPENFGLFIKTPVGNILHSSDFKFDKTPINDLPTDFQRLKEISERKILLLLSDSTGAEEEGHSLSEKTIFENLDKIFKQSAGRIIASTFASHIHRIQQLITLSERYDRKVVIEGLSMKENLEIARTLKYLQTNKGTFIKPEQISKFPDSKISFICTGAQGEREATLMKIANKEYKFLRLKKGDTIIFSSSVVPGNERTVQILKDEFHRQGTKVFHYQMMDIHASGHAHRQELTQMLQIMKPKFFLPIHGQYSMLVSHAELAKVQGIPKENIVVAENGDVINLSPKRIFLEKTEIPSNYVMVDGLGIGDVGEVVLRDRQTLAQDGMFVIVAVVDRQAGKVRGSPDIISRGFVYLRESKELLKETRKRVIAIVDRAAGSGGAVNWAYVKDELRNKIGQFLFYKTKRRPIVLPVVIEV
ncbi:MAG: ribonuclease J [Patescibacteria group bacterium]|nr:ribonuclease J [Patescibacteria group bacterium]